MPHALLLSGQHGLGKRDFALDLAKAMLCAQPKDTGAGCGECRACRQFDAGSHPDFSLIEPEAVGKQIKIDQLRELIQILTLASHQGGFRVAIINPAENMNSSAANALLKTLEEPPSDTLLLLVCERPSVLPVTILSRCQQLKFSPPREVVALDWLISTQSVTEDAARTLLAISQYAPLEALSCAQAGQIELRNTLFASFQAVADDGESALQAVKPWLKLDLPGPINWLYSWVADLIRIKVLPETELINRDLSTDLHNLAQRVDLNGLFRLQDELLSVLRYQRAPFNLQLLFENLFLCWEELVSRRPMHRRT